MIMFVENENGEFSDPLRTTVDVKQGGNASPILFNHLINRMLDILIESKFFYKINNKSVGLFVFADDTTVVSLCAMRLAIRLNEKFCSDYDVTINAKKLNGCA